ncbi:hypothetical protein CXB51_013782 [Gossypium anomalum]|uniref:Uncharacterized protein n=1 Tax=Gossypium anomalum TaxID=47600 RepID=A0A8J5Z8Z0_9ROSI|nr:hypothetical protein CXB51_013782 [Gossypium anomalum]
MKNQKESPPPSSDSILTEKNSDDTDGAQRSTGCRWPFCCKGTMESQTSGVGRADNARGRGTALGGN